MFEKTYEDRLKDQRRVKKNKRKNGLDQLDHTWANKRSKNIEQMFSKMRKDESYLLGVVYNLLTNYADIPWRMGDENMSILIAWCANQIDGLRRRSKPKRKKRHKT